MYSAQEESRYFIFLWSLLPLNKFKGNNIYNASGIQNLHNPSAIGTPDTSCPAVLTQGNRSAKPCVFKPEQKFRIIQVPSARPIPHALRF